MKLIKITFIALFSLFLLFAVDSFVYAESLESDSGNYKIDGLAVGTQGGAGMEADSGNFSIMPFIGDSLNNEKLNSLSYQMGTGITEILNVNVPIVSCFETDTDYFNGEGEMTECEHSAIATGESGEPLGMVRLCGEGGCYDRARIEIDVQNNPSDTLYAIQITTTSDWSYYGYIDGNTRTIKSPSNLSIDDFLTKTDWENVADVYNILGLTPGTEYFVRISALQGDFTQSAFGPSKSAITAQPTLRMSLNVGATYGEDSSPIHTINFNYLSSTSVETANKLIWLSYGTNALNGISGSVIGENDGLYSSESLYTITSDFYRANLAGSEGFGIVGSDIEDTLLGPTLVASDYVESSYYAGGIVSTGGRTVFTSSGNPLYDGVLGIKAFAKISSNTPTGEYEELLTFSIIPVF